MTGLPPGLPASGDPLLLHITQEASLDFVGTVLFLRPLWRAGSHRYRTNKTRSSRCGLLVGRDDRIRTCDPYVPNVVRYRAALHPVFLISGGKNNTPWATWQNRFVINNR